MLATSSARFSVDISRHSKKTKNKLLCNKRFQKKESQIQYAWSHSVSNGHTKAGLVWFLLLLFCFYSYLQSICDWSLNSQRALALRELVQSKLLLVRNHSLGSQRACCLAQRHNVMVLWYLSIFWALMVPSAKLSFWHGLGAVSPCLQFFVWFRCWGPAQPHQVRSWRLAHATLYGMTTHWFCLHC